MGWFDNPIELAEARSRIIDLELANERLQRRVDELAAEKVDAIKADVEASSFEIDWKNMDVFSIERMGDKNAPYTVLGYWVTENGNKYVHEWTFYCSLAQHNKLAEEFRKATKK